MGLGGQNNTSMGCLTRKETHVTIGTSSSAAKGPHPHTFLLPPRPPEKPPQVPWQEEVRV